MTTDHRVEITLDTDVQIKLAAGEYALPEHFEDRDWHILCSDPTRCIHYEACESFAHICPHGSNAINGPEEPSEDNVVCPDHSPTCYQDEDVFDFHGVEHTWRYGWGWTIDLPSCAVAALISEAPEGVDQLPVGTYDANVDWPDDETCYVDVVPINKESQK